jgi:hypothetical protein
MPSSVQVFGVQPELQTPGCPPPPQTAVGGQVPQLIVSPHPSPAMPQLKPSEAQVAGMQVMGSGMMQEAKSKSMNSRVFSWGLILVGGW